MMELITFYEYSGYKTASSPISTNLKPTFNAQEIENLVHLSKTLFPGEEIFNIGREQIKATSIVGSILTKNKHIQILPKLLSRNDQEQNTILRNLMHMLLFTHKLDISDLETTNLSHYHGNFLEVYISIFAKRLLKLLLRYPPRSFTNQANNLNHIRGKIELSEHLKINLIDQSKMYCSYNELTEDNLLTQTFKYVSSILLRHTSNGLTYSRLRKILNILSDTTQNSITYEKIKSLQITRKSTKGFLIWRKCFWLN